MSRLLDGARVVAWHAGKLTDGELASSLRCDPQQVSKLLATEHFRAECDPGEGGGGRLLSPRLRVGLAIAHALHHQAGLPVEAAAEVVAGSWRICGSILATLDFEAPQPGDRTRADGASERRVECDPLMLFAPHASEELPIPAIDEYLDVIDGRRLVWRKPKEEAYRLACELHRLSGAGRGEPSPGRQEDFLTLLSRMRERREQVSEWVGIVDRRGFRPPPDRHADQTPFLRHGILAACGDTSRMTETYATKISVNISLAARSMKRRALGLEVIGVLERSARTSFPARRVTFGGSIAGSLPLGPAPARQSER